MSKQVVLFWDLENTYWTLLEYYGQVESPIERIIDYLFDLYKEDSIRVFRAYADYEKLRSSISNAQTIVQKMRVTPKHVFSSNSGSQNRKNAADIELGLDALEIVFKSSEVNEFVVISADKDMIPLINRLRYYDKNVVLVYLEAAIAEDRLILNFPNKSISVESILNLDINSVNKNPSEADLEIYLPFAIQITNDFYTRNKEKPHMYLGNSIFIDEMIKAGTPKQIASKVLEFCINNGHLAYDKSDKRKIITNEKDVAQSS